LVKNLTEVAFSAKDKNDVKITRASFALDPGLCGRGGMGREIEFSGKTEKDGSITIKARLLMGYHWESRYEPGYTDCDHRGRCWRTPGRWYEERVADFEYGTFSKK
jgi:hypothetical protein